MTEDVRLQKIRKLEEELKSILNNLEIDESKQAAIIGGYLVPTGGEEVVRISYVRNLFKEAAEKFGIFRIEIEKDVKWPYTGFISGFLGLPKIPLSHQEILNLLDKHQLEKERSSEELARLTNSGVRVVQDSRSYDVDDLTDVDKYWKWREIWNYKKD
ncbi:MAG TPA: hypothetical protein VJZ93_01815 [Candidatus Nanoarchaeia archaeon]|nr:hypothetical protein [Candidatus Nanoarchaeia archaeon]